MDAIKSSSKESAILHEFGLLWAPSIELIYGLLLSLDGVVESRSFWTWQFLLSMTEYRAANTLDV